MVILIMPYDNHLSLIWVLVIQNLTWRAQILCLLLLFSHLHLNIRVSLMSDDIHFATMSIADHFITFHVLLWLMGAWLLMGQVRLCQVHLGTKLSCLFQTLISIQTWFCSCISGLVTKRSLFVLGTRYGSILVLLTCVVLGFISVWSNRRPHHGVEVMSVWCYATHQRSLYVRIHNCVSLDVDVSSSVAH